MVDLDNMVVLLLAFGGIFALISIVLLLVYILIRSV
jgi:hypothetical protein